MIFNLVHEEAHKAPVAVRPQGNGADRVPSLLRQFLESLVAVRAAEPSVHGAADLRETRLRVHGGRERVVRARGLIHQDGVQLLERSPARSTTSSLAVPYYFATDKKILCNRLCHIGCGQKARSEGQSTGKLKAGAAS